MTVQIDLIALLGFLVALVMAAFGFWRWIAGSIGKAHTRVDAAMAALSGVRIEMAKEYVTASALKEVEDRLVKYLEKIEAAVNRRNGGAVGG